MDAIERELSRSIGGNIRKARQLVGLNQSQLAHALGISYQQVQKYETGVNRVSATTLFRLSNLLRCALTDFFVGIEVGGLPAPPSNPPAEHFFAERFLRSLSRIEDKALQIQLVKLVHSIAHLQKAAGN